MKTKLAKFIVSLACALGFFQAAPAKAECYVYYANPCIGAGADLYYAPGRWIADPDMGAYVDAGRCMQRSNEYRAWCGNQTVTSAFNTQGRTVIGSQAVGNSSAIYIYTGSWVYTGFHYP